MQKIKVLLLGCLFVVTAAAAAPYQISEGFGHITSATTSPQNIEFVEAGTNVYAVSVSVYNSGTNMLFCAVNITTGNFAGKISSTNAVPIPANSRFTFNGESLHNICLQTTNGSTVVYIGAY